MADGDIFQAVFTMLLPDDVIAKNVYYLEQTSSSPTNDQLILDDIEAYLEDLYSEIVGGIDSEISVQLCDVYRRNTTLDTWERVGDVLPDVTFTLSAEMVSHGVAAVMRGLTAFGKSIARKFIAGFPETVIAQSVWDSATLTALANFALQWVSVYTAIQGQYAPGTWRTVANEFAIFTGTTFVNVLNGYQRRRQPGAGE